MRRGVHRLDAVVALETTGALGIDFGLGLVDPVARGTSGGASERLVRRVGGGRAVAGGGISLSGSEGRNEKNNKEKKKTLNVQRPTPNAQRQRRAAHRVF